MPAAEAARLRRSRIWLAFGLAAGLACAGSSARGAGGDARPSSRVSLTLLSTTDLHGHIFPEDDFTGVPANQGLAKIATLVSEVRAQHPNTLLFDCGDTIQGSPLAFIAARQMRGQVNPMMAAMNKLEYAAMAVGNHDFNFGLEVLSKARREAKFPFLAANLRSTGGENPAGIESYIVRTIAGVRVGIVGFVTPGVPRWELPENYRGYEFEGIVHAAQRVIPEVRAKSDLLVVIMHSGLGREPETGKPSLEGALSGENAVVDLAESVPGIDVLFYGHTHLELAGKLLHGVLVAQAKNWGQSLAEADVDLERDASGAWHVVTKSSKLIRVTSEVSADAQILSLARPYQEASETWLKKEVSSSPGALDAETSRVEPNALLALTHRAQMEAGHADVSLATMFSTAAHFPGGAVTVRNIFSLYPYENTLFTVEMTGAQLKAALEHAASFYPAWPWKEGEPVRLPGYEADTAAGVEYVIDLAKPAGQRVGALTMAGKPLDAEKKLRVAVNHYRYYGGGGYGVFRGLPVLRRSTAGVRELLLEYISTKEKRLTGETPGNWRIEPRQASDALRAQAMQPRHSAPR